MQLDNKVAAVTGASSVIGKASALALLAGEWARDRIGLASVRPIDRR